MRTASSMLRTEASRVIPRPPKSRLASIVATLSMPTCTVKHSFSHQASSGQLMLITCVCLPLPAWFAMLVAGLLSSPSTHMPIKLEDVRSSLPPKNHMMHDGSLTSAIFVLVAVDATAARWSQEGRQGEDRGIDHGRV